ncbi:ubiquitin-specific protease otu1 [Rhizina undulata]
MRIKVRSSAGSQVLTLPSDATVSTLLSEIRTATSIAGNFDIKYGYPPKNLNFADLPPSSLLSELSVKLEGEQLIVSESGGSSSFRSSGAGGVAKPTTSTSGSRSTQNKDAKKTGIYTPSTIGASKSSDEGVPFTFAGQSNNKPSNSRSSNPPISGGLSLTHAPMKSKMNKDDPPDIPIPNGRGTIVLRVMEDDNSCLFRAISYVTTNSLYSVEELRQLVATTIQSDPEKYSDAVLDQPRDGYCEWITMENSWGGGIELGIFASFFDVEICTIDVATNDVIRFNEGHPKRAIVIYSGIHYDALAFSPSGSLPHDSSNDIRIFDSDDAMVLEGALELCRELRKRKYFTDTKNFDLKCNDCGAGLKGEKGAVEHASKTGHMNYGEY